MTYLEFQEKIVQQMQAKLSADAKVTIHSITKNNNIQLDGLSVMEPNVNITPTIYLNSFYDAYQNGRSFDRIFEEIYRTYTDNKPVENIDVTFFTDYNNVKEHLAFKLVNFQRNQKLLADVPFLPYLDLAIVFYCLVSSNSTGNASILIHNNHLNLWQITREDLYAQALKNTPLLLPYELRNMSDVMSELLMSDEFSLSESMEDFSTPYPMFVLSNETKLNGACCILYQNILKKIAQKMQADLFVLPSSIHEVILIPAYVDDSVTELSEMVQEVNATQVLEEEILSDHVYYYSKSKDILTLLAS